MLSQGFLRVIFTVKASLNSSLILMLLINQIWATDYFYQNWDEMMNTNDTITGDHHNDTILPLTIPNNSSDDQTKDRLVYRFMWSTSVTDFLQSSEESVTGLFSHELYRCICSTEIRTADGFLSRAKYILPLAFMLNLVATALQEALKYLLINVLQVQSWPLSFINLGLVQSAILLLAMIYMTVQIAVSMMKAARFRDQQNPAGAARGSGGFGNFLFFLPFVILAAHVIKLTVKLIQITIDFFFIKKQKECLTKILDALENGFLMEAAIEDGLQCLFGDMYDFVTYSIPFYCSSLEFCYVISHMIRKKIAEKEK